jgi:polyisoprenoid-binding protein YceI
MKTKLFLLAGLGLLLVGTARSATLEVDQGRSRIQVDAKATGHAFTGTLRKFTASVAGVPGELSPSAFRLGWNFKDLDTDDEKRDKEMIKWLGGGDPKGSFEFIKSWTDAKGARHAQGELTINGVSKTISFPYTAKQDGEWITISGTAALDYQNFKLPIIRSMAVMTVDPGLAVRFHVVGKIK